MKSKSRRNRRRKQEAIEPMIRGYDWNENSGFSIVSATGVGATGRAGRVGPTALAWAKCPFCGVRQHIEKDGPYCGRCGGDVLSENVK